ncbi:Uncharacterised protein [Chlamydia trachomatis]|nr:Uncharacterised protein [Chlamydia trachomatis]
MNNFDITSLFFGVSLSAVFVSFLVFFYLYYYENEKDNARLVNVK